MDNVLDLMSANPVIVGLDNGLGDCARALVGSRVRHLAVVNARGELAGVVTDFSVFEHGGWSAASGWTPKNYRGADKARDVMVEAAVVCHPSDDLVPVLIELAKSLQDFVVVVDDERCPVGFVTEHLAVREAQHRVPMGVSVDDHGTENVVTLQHTAAASRARALMREHQIRHVIVMSGDDLRGVISFRDLLERDAERRPTTTCDEVASTDVTTIGRGHDVRDAAERMAQRHIGCLPVTDGRGQLTGIVTRTDVLIALLNELAS